MILPDFIVIGAMKAGTTTLYRYLDAHPEIGMSRLKETDFFIAERNFRRGIDWYSSQFTPGKRLYGEASPNYAKARDFPGVPERIASRRPDVKLIYLVRDPVARFVSQYSHSYLTGALKATPEEIFGGHEWAHILDASLYHRQLTKYLECFAEDRILILDFDELTQTPETTLGRVGAFLGVEGLTATAGGRAENTREAVAATPAIFYQARRLGVTDLVRPLVPAAAERKLKELLGRGRAKRVAPPVSEDLRARIAEACAADAAAFRAAVGLGFPQWRV